MKTQVSNKLIADKPSMLFNIKEALKIVIKFLGITTWIIVFFMALLEIKNYYNIDVIPGVDTPIEKVYDFTFGALSGIF